MRIRLLWASPNRVLLQNLVIHIKFWGFRYVVAIGKLESIHTTEFSNLVLKMVILMFSGSSHFGLPFHLSFQNVWEVYQMDDIHFLSGTFYHCSHACPSVSCHNNHSVLFYFVSHKIV